MGRYAIEPDNATKAAKARGSNLRVHFKVSYCYIIFHCSTNKNLYKHNTVWHLRCEWFLIQRQDPFYSV